MGFILKISLRNLLRQKRRNILLGSGIAFGMCILIVSNAFSHGLSDILLNKIIVWMTGHIVVTMREKNEKEWEIIRDKERIQQVIQANVAGDKDVLEGVATVGRALGNEGAEFIVVVGVEPDESFYQGMSVVAGNLRDLTNPNIENPIAIYDKMADNLNVKFNDTIRVRFESVYGQIQAVRFSVVAIMKADNPFMSVASFTHLKRLKALMGYKDNETGTLSVHIKNLKNPQFVTAQANRLHDALQPNVAGYQGAIQANARQKDVRVFAAAADQTSRQQFASQFQIVGGALDDTLADKQAALISQAYATALGVRIGDQLTAAYDTKFEGTLPAKTYRVGAIFKANGVVADDMVFLHAKQFYATFYPAPPQKVAALERTSVLFPVLLKEWDLLARSPDEKALKQKYDALADSKWHGAILDVQTMYELASNVLKMEQVLNMVTLAAVLVLFFIILIGVVNTLRMTIRERTREIGTVRAIGMQQRDVHWSFITEALLLALFASAAGTVLAFLVMKLVGLITFHAEESFLTIFLVEKHLYFLPTITDIVQNLLIIVGITLFTAYFPARRAARMSVAGALRHFE